MTHIKLIGSDKRVHWEMRYHLLLMEVRIEQDRYDRICRLKAKYRLASISSHISQMMNGIEALSCASRDQR